MDAFYNQTVGDITGAARRVTTEEFFLMPEDTRAELIDGVVYDMAAPGAVHQRMVMELSSEINSYIKKKGGPCKVYPAPFDVMLKEGGDDVVEPDISVICDPSKVDGKRCVGAPDWVVEVVSPGNATNDYVRKLSLYLNAGVREYWIVNPEDRSVVVYNLSDRDSLAPVVYTMDDTVHAGIYEDLEIDFKRILEDL